MTYHFVTETVTELLEIRHRVAAVKDPKVKDSDLICLIFP